ncbi:hypothetical protein MTR67_024022, partial [Solanum verrucosum]
MKFLLVIRNCETSYGNYKFCLNLLVDSKAHKVVFAECGKDFIDFLFTILKLPIAYFVGQPSCMSVFACLANMIPIMKIFNNDFMQLDEVDEVMTDNLFIAPLSVTSVINVLRTSKAQVDQLQHITIDFQISDLKQEFLQVSLRSKIVLTNLSLRQTGWRKSNNGEKCSLKLTIDTKTNRVVFAEGGKDLFCFLMRLLELLIAIFMNHIQTNRVGSIPNIYQSVQNLNDAYMQSTQTKDQLLRSSESKSWSQALELVQVTPLSMISGLSKLTNVESTAEIEVKTIEFVVNELVEFGTGAYFDDPIEVDVNVSNAFSDCYQLEGVS